MAKGQKIWVTKKVVLNYNSKYEINFHESILIQINVQIKSGEEAYLL